MVWIWQRRARVAKIIFFAALLFTLIMAFLPHPPQVPLEGLGDKFQHSTAFIVLSLLGAGAFPQMPLPRLGERLSFVGALIELVQSIPMLHRDCDIMDWITDTAAIIATLFVVYLLRRIFSGRQKSNPSQSD